MNKWQILLIAAFAIMSIVGFALMGIDKKRAQKNQWRIKEASLFLVAFLLGGVGSTVGMWAFRHKTKHWYFKYGMPLLALINIGIVVVGFILLRT